MGGSESLEKRLPGSRPQGKIRWEQHCLFLEGRLTGQHLLFACKGLYEIITEKEHKEVFIDASRCESVFEAFMLPLLPLIARYREEDEVDFLLREPEDARLKRLFRNANWAHFIDPREYEDMAGRELTHMCARRFSTGDEQDSLIGQVIEVVLGSLTRLRRKNLKALEWALGEITENVLTHAESAIGGFMQATNYGDSEVEFVVADAGIGIPKSLRMEQSPAEAVRQAVEERRSKDTNTNAGNGLFGSYQVALLSKGQFEIHSHRAHLCLTKDKVHVGTERIRYAGTCVRCRINCSDESSLEKALVFGGVSHDPPYDHIEAVYEKGEKGEMIVHMKEEQARTRSREGGRAVHTKLKNLLREGKKLVCDFDDMTVVSSSFADEVFGRLFDELGPIGFQQRIEFRNLDRTIKVLIDAAMRRRLILNDANNKEKT